MYYLKILWLIRLTYKDLFEFILNIGDKVNLVSILGDYYTVILQNPPLTLQSIIILWLAFRPPNNDNIILEQPQNSTNIFIFSFTSSLSISILAAINLVFLNRIIKVTNSFLYTLPCSDSPSSTTMDNILLSATKLTFKGTFNGYDNKYYWNLLFYKKKIVFLFKKLDKFSLVKTINIFLYFVATCREKQLSFLLSPSLSSTFIYSSIYVASLERFCIAERALDHKSGFVGFPGLNQSERKK